jgi:lactoylglutathione lyase
MKIEHVSVWVRDLECMKDFYLKYFIARCGEKYTNKKKKYSSYYIVFQDVPRLELMCREDILEKPDYKSEYYGWAHIAISLGSREKVLELTERFRREGYDIVGEPRVTGDGYFESVILDPEGNRIELTI